MNKDSLPRIVIVDYGMGNVASIRNMIEYAGGNCEVSGNPDDLRVADKLILPGVGRFDFAVERLTTLGLFDLIRAQAVEEHKPLLGICLGMQLLLDGSEEGPEVRGLGLIPGTCTRFRFEDSAPKLSVPHMGWNYVQLVADHPLMASDFDWQKFYFVHSYHVNCDPAHIVGLSDYGGQFPCVIASGNVVGTQFHPEKSHKYGMNILRNFSEVEEAG